MTRRRIEALQRETQNAIDECRRRHLTAWQVSFEKRRQSLAKLLKRKFDEGRLNLYSVNRAV